MAIADGEQVAAWVQAARRGDGAAFGRLVRQFQDAVAGVAVARLGPGPEVEDVAQEAFLAAYRQLGELPHPPGFGPWVCAIARNIALRRLRDRRPQAPLSSDPAAPPRPEPGELADRLMAAVRRLPERLGEPLTLFYINGYSTREVAGLLEIPPGTVRRRLHEARNHLREYLETDMAEQIRRNAPRPGFAEFVVEEVKAAPGRPPGITSLSSNDPSFTQEQADAQWGQIKALIAEGRFTLLEVRDADSGGKIHLYEFFLADGRRIVFGTDRPLEPTHQPPARGADTDSPAET